MTSEWAVNLEFAEGGSSKFWRARIDGGVLYVNFGRIGTAGQVQMKDLGTPDAAAKEMDKLVREKRKKGYDEAGGADDADEEEEAPPPRKTAAAPVPVPAPVPRVGPPRADSIELVLQGASGRIVTRATLDGATVSVQSTEAHGDPDAAASAFDRLKAALLSDGHRLA